MSVNSLMTDLFAWAAHANKTEHPVTKQANYLK